MTPHVYTLMFAMFICNALERTTEEQITESLPIFDGRLIATAMLADRPLSERELTLPRLRPYQRLLLERAPGIPGEDIPELIARVQAVAN